MSTATTTEEATPTTETGPLERAERLRSRLDALRADIEDLRERDEALGDRLSSLLLEGDEEDSVEARAIREERADVRTRLGEREELLPVLAEKVEAETGEAVREAAEARLHTLRKKLGGIAGERPRMLERVDEARAAVEEAERVVKRAVGRYSALRTEAVALADLFGLDLPDLREIPTKEAAPRPRGPGTSPDEYLRDAVRRVEGYREETPSGDLLDLFDFDPEEYRARRKAERRAERKAEEEAAEAAREEVDSFLRSILRAGPVKRAEVLRRAASAGFDTARNYDRTSLQDSRERVGVRTLAERVGGAVYYARADLPFDSDRFRELRSEGATLAGLR